MTHAVMELPLKRFVALIVSVTLSTSTSTVCE
jgi:hypothetical protein